jgi:hypothetical protein
MQAVRCKNRPSCMCACRRNCRAGHQAGATWFSVRGRASQRHGAQCSVSVRLSVRRKKVSVPCVGTHESTSPLYTRTRMRSDSHLHAQRRRICLLPSPGTCVHRHSAHKQLAHKGKQAGVQAGRRSGCIARRYLRSAAVCNGAAQLHNARQNAGRTCTAAAGPAPSDRMSAPRCPPSRGSPR